MKRCILLVVPCEYISDARTYECVKLQDGIAVIMVCSHMSVGGVGGLIIYADPDIHVNSSAKHSKFHTPEIFRDS